MPNLDASSPFVRFLVGAYAIGSVITFVAFGVDKWRAARKGRRVPERTLHLLTFAFGFPGALLGMLAFRHKTRKPAFIVVTALLVAVHVALAGFALAS
ncbi:MAG: hypothetical protein BGO98_37115 [Myxococcales bacterium 68-20]|nr:DUF1294 domain-containing protein [Myxococcales bacterium]OJY22216.1 MAG: hypothetical protein BGO98_37115 [Myxococcales bacterium 68-20]